MSESSIEVIFEVCCDYTKPGDSVLVVGSIPALGNWSVSQAVGMVTNHDLFPIW